MARRHGWAKHWVIEILWTEIKERPVRLASFILVLLAVSSLVPYAERHAPDGTVVRHGADGKEGTIATDRAGTCLGNSPTGVASNLSGGNCTFAGYAESIPWDTTQALPGGRKGSNVPA